MSLLKNGTEISDSRLDRLIQFDERSRNFPIRTLVGDKPLRSYTWRCNEWLDQGREGACVAYAIGHELAARPAEVTGIHDAWLVRNIYWEAQKIDPWPGGAYPGATPRYEGTSVLAGIKVSHKKNLFKEYRWAFGINDLLNGLGHNGPAVLGLNWYEGMYSPNSEGFIKPTGRLMGGHAIMARAINIKEEKVTLRNSWGSSWGLNGDCYISFEDLNKLLKENGEAAFLIKRTALFHNASL